MVEAGHSPEQIARALNEARLQLEREFRQGLRPEIVEEIEQRQMERYGNRTGPTVEWLREQGRTWEQIIQSAMRPGGQDMWRLFFGE